MSASISIPLPVRIIKASEIIKGIGAEVYSWRRGNKWLYVGSSQMALKRIVSHHVIGKVEAIQSQDVFEVWSCADREEALLLEGQLINQFLPEHNTETEREWLTARIERTRLRRCGHEWKRA